MGGNSSSPITHVRSTSSLLWHGLVWCTLAATTDSACMLALCCIPVACAEPWNRKQLLVCRGLLHAPMPISRSRPVSYEKICFRGIIPILKPPPKEPVLLLSSPCCAISVLPSPFYNHLRSTIISVLLESRPKRTLFFVSSRVFPGNTHGCPWGGSHSGRKSYIQGVK